MKPASGSTSKGVENCSGMNKGGTQDVGPLKVTMTHAVHSCGIQDGDQILYGGEAAGYVLHLPGSAARFTSRATPRCFPTCSSSSKLYQPGLAFLPIGDFYTMGPQRSRARVPFAEREDRLIPMHFGTFPALTGNPEELARQLKDFPHTQVWPLEIGKPAKW